MLSLAFVIDAIIVESARLNAWVAATACNAELAQLLDNRADIRIPKRRSEFLKSEKFPAPFVVLFL